MENIDTEKLNIIITEMTPGDVREVQLLENLCFDETWPEEQFLKEIGNKRSACYITARSKGKLVGYMGSWLILDEAHITTIAVDPEFRGMSIGKLLVWELFNRAISKGSRWATLEVSVKNDPAKILYEHFGFTKIGKRSNYYESGEDALVMWAGNIQGQIFRQRLDKIKTEWEEKLCLSLE